MLKHGAIVDLPNVMGVTPLMAASGLGLSPRDTRGSYGPDAQERSIAVLDVLLKAGADINARIIDTTSHTAGPAPTDPGWAGGTEFTDSQVQVTTASARVSQRVVNRNAGAKQGRHGLGVELFLGRIGDVKTFALHVVERTDQFPIH